MLALGALAAALILGTGEAAAQTGVCAGDPPPSGSRIDCSLGSIANDINIDARNVAISVTTSTVFQPAVDARATGGAGNIIVRLGQGLDVTTSGGASQIGSYSQHEGAGDVSIVMEDGASIATVSRFAHGINAIIDGGGSGDITARMTGGSITTSGNGTSGILLQQHNAGALTADMSGGSIRVTGSVASGIGASGIYLYSEGAGAVTATFSGGTIEKSGGSGAGIGFEGEATSTADVSIRMSGGSITASGAGINHGVRVVHRGTGGGGVNLGLTGGSITISSDSSRGVSIWLSEPTNPDGISIAMSGGAISTSGEGSHGIQAQTEGPGVIRIAMTGGTIDASGAGSSGIRIPSGSDGDTTVTVNGGVVMGGTGTGAGAGAGVYIIGRGEVVVGGNARIGARSGRAIFGSSSGELVVTIVDPDVLGGAGMPRIEGRIVKIDDSLRVRLRPAGSSESFALRAGGPSAPSGAWDVSLEEDGDGVRVVREYGPRARVYEALPSVLLGLNGLASFRERTSAPRTEKGGWARVEASRGDWSADESTTGGLEYDHWRAGLRAGLDVPVGEEVLLGFSVHHRQGSADVLRGGEVDLSGFGAGVSGAWMRGGVYVDAQGELTSYKADFHSSSRGMLKEEVSGRGHALGLEVGYRAPMPEMAGVVLTPRAGVEHSRVELDNFTDAVGARVHMEDAKSLKGRVGLVVEAEPDGSPHRLSGSLDMEHEFEDDPKVRMTLADLEPKAEATWVRLGVDGSRAWSDGRHTLSGGLSYAIGGDSDEFGGAVSWKMRF